MIRQADVDDLPAVGAIAQAAWPVAYATILSPGQLAYMLELMYSERALLDQMTLKGHRFLLAEESGKAIGFAAFETHVRGSRRTRLHKLYVLPKTKGSGVGAALLEAVCAAARAGGDAQVELNVNRSNPTMAWYLRRGFVIERDEVIDIGHGYAMDDLVMLLDLWA